MRSIKGMISEDELLKILNLETDELAYLRRSKALPFVKLSSRVRVYLEADLMTWFRENRAGTGKAGE